MTFWKVSPLALAAALIASPPATAFEFPTGPGANLFTRDWTGNGLGPLFNARSCNECHGGAGTGPAPDAAGPLPPAMPVRLGILPLDTASLDKLKAHRVAVFPDPAYGMQLQPQGLAGIRPEASVTVSYTERRITLAGSEIVSLRQPSYTVSNLQYGPMEHGRMLSPRRAPQLFGAGLLAAVPDTAIIALADEADADGDGISGRVAKVWDETDGAVRIGRFGWKAGQPSLRQQVAAALINDIGVSSPVFADGRGDCTKRQPDCRNRPQNEREISETELAALTEFVRKLPAPEANPQPAAAGMAVFISAGCATCHRPTLKTGADHRLPQEWRNREIRPYTDLLLHDLGPALSDTFAEGIATFWEWRTPPLWGLSSQTHYLHDGRARTLLEAILWHGGEAEASRDAVIAMSPKDRQALIDFLNSL